MDSPEKQNGLVLELSTDGDEAELGPLPVLLSIELPLSGPVPAGLPYLLWCWWWCEWWPPFPSRDDVEVDCDDCDEPSSSEKDTFSEGEERSSKKSVSGHRVSVFLRSDMGLIFRVCDFLTRKLSLHHLLQCCAKRWKNGYAFRCIKCLIFFGKTSFQVLTKQDFSVQTIGNLLKFVAAEESFLPHQKSIHQVWKGLRPICPHSH